jgi:general secretion pathway protein D
LPLRYISANIARQRILELLGLTQQRTGVVGGAGAINPETGQPIGQPTQPGMSGSVASISSLPQRLTIDPQGNDLLLKGSASEASLVAQALQIVDVPSRLVGKYYNVGGAAQTVASQGRAQGLGEVVTLQTGFGSAVGADGRPTPQLNLAGLAGGGPQETLQGGPRFVIDPQNRGFTYFGTPEQQAQLEAMMQGLEQLLVSDEVVYEFYPLLNAKADKVADALRGLIANQVPSSGSGSVLLPGGSALGGRNSRGAGAPRDFRSPLLRDRSSNQATTTAAAAANRMTTGDTAIDATEDVFVLEYEDTNTILVKAPRRLQPQFRQLISKLDIRRPQVYIEAQIIVVTGSDEQRLAVETQLINAGGKGGVLRTLFTPSPSQSGTVSGNITVPPVINPLTGITAAIINSDMVPVIITAIATTTNARIVASPKILVDDNVEATILSKEERPTQTQVTNSGSGGTTTGFGGFEEAGPELTVKPQISAGGYIRLNYSLDLSAFIGEAPSAFTPPPRQTNKIESESVTVPSDSTIVVGGLTFDQKRKTVVKVPLLGDIPIIGHAFRDERDNVSSSTIYVFITPRIMREEDFDDLRLLSKGPMVDVKLPEDLPPPRLVAVENVAPVLPEPSPTLAPADRPPPPLPSGD